MKVVHFLCLILSSISTASYAVLGELNSANNARNLTLKSTSDSNATVRFQVQNDNSVTIKEYVGADGIVYAVTWHGPRPPDLITLLGKYFPEYSAAKARTPLRIPRRGLTATSLNLQINQFGHPGSLRGLIYLKDKLPANIHPEDLQ